VGFEWMLFMARLSEAAEKVVQPAKANLRR
jgi:hypothetical protein